MCVCMCVCVSVSKCVYERECVCARARVCVYVGVCDLFCLVVCLTDILFVYYFARSPIFCSCCCTLLSSFVCLFVRLVSFLPLVVPGLVAVVAACL